ncbi:MAG: hypothetical protein KF696_14000 [Planctomycetes bacterium]|nr:hypothetical protein [Planctomycetota bacterium]MCW8136892.1 hypothetical protein [Planctomycetota bacterium]
MHLRWVMLMLCLAAPLAATTHTDDFAMPKPGRQASSLFQDTPRTDRTGGEDFDNRWPWRGIEVSSYSGLFPVVLAASQAVDVGIPILPWVSVVTRIEGTVGLLFSGGIVGLGFRGHLDFSDTFGIYGEVMGRFGFGELTIARIFADMFREFIDAGVSTVSGFGFSLASGIEVGGRRAKFFAGLEYGALFIDGQAFVGNTRFDLPTITINYFGFQVGIRFYFG